MPQATLNFNYLDKRTINALYDNCLCFTALDDNCNIGFSIHNTAEAGDNPNTFNISYSVDNGYTWNSITASGSDTVGNIATINAGKNLLVRGTNKTLEGFRFTSGKGKTFNLSGNILSLLDDDIDNINELPNYCFTGASGYGIFAKTGVIDASRLHLPYFTSLGCYAGMFRLSSLVKAPALPATELSERCYVYMFSSCTSLVSPPELPALSIPTAAYAAMFQHCAALTEAPALPATTLSIECYMQMFYGCKSLATAPGLPAIYLANSCYDAMFRACTSLVSPPELPAQLIYQLNASGNPHEHISARCYRYMFAGCTSLTYAPYLPSKIIPQDGYDNMFDGCTNLSYIHIAAEPIDTTSTYTNRLSNWVRNVAPTGTFVKSPNSVYLIDSNNGVPTGWTVYNDGDEIPERVNVTVTANDDSMGTVYGGGTYATGTYVQIQAIPNLGYILRYWLIDDEVVTDASTYRFQVSQNTTAQAVFEIEDAELPKYTITLNSVPGNVTGWALHGGGEYSQGSTVAISCENSGNTTQTFDGWYTRDENMNYTLISSSLEFIIRVTEDVEYYAMFKDVVPEYCYVYAGLDPRSTGMGSTTGSGDYVRGSNCTLQAYPLEGYQFICWTIDGERTSSTNPITLLVDKSYQYLAYIKPIMPKYNMTIENNAMWGSEIRVNVDYTIVEGMDMDDYDGNTHDPKLWIYQNIEEGSNVVVNAIKHNDYIDFDGWWTKDDHGTMRLLSNEEKYSFKMTDDTYLYCKWKVHEEEDATDYSKEYFTITALQDNTDVYADIIISSQGYTGPSYTIEASVNNGEFVEHLITRAQNDYAFERLICTLNNGDNVRLRAVMPWDWSYSGIHYIVKNLLIAPSKMSKISGNLLSLVAGTGYLNSNLLSSNYISFPFVFNSNIFDARNVWFPYLSDVTQNAHWSNAESYYLNYYNTSYNYNDGRFSHMFAYNSYMLAGPKSINENVDYYAYSFLFKDCHNIFDSPICPATTLAEGCYLRMFEGCDKLVNGVNLMGTTLAEGCYTNMYKGCSNLQNPGSLNANTLVRDCYNGMYNGCTSLQTAPQLKAEQMVNGCYNNMFWGCEQLNFIEIDLKYKSPAGEWGMYNMFTSSPNAYPDGRLYKDPTVSWMTREYLNSEGTNIPANWTFEDISTT